ncbi:MAG: bifunctional N-acetylglucosamine-1-phosphate uridyltransferase/glucosamine-1-phosphate acetyltransferase [Planctomycetes bacterium]|nr:bifunctional N-acetylglucosamine-1-phosphate uridyltransferase/glucosamine-1-phosphate acetyltransferase [Planctomycetota bacterium]
MPRPLAVIVLAAGLGTRTKVSIPKVLLPLCGRTLLGTVLDTVADLTPDRTVVVLHHGKDEIERTLADRSGLTIVDQGEPRGTGHAVQVAMHALEGFEGDVMVVYGDVPLITVDTLVELRASRGDHGVSVLTALPDDPTGLGRILRDADDEFVGIREERDCSDDELAIPEINAGIYCYDAAVLRPLLEGLSDDNAQRELYLTDTIQALLEDGRTAIAVEVADAEEVSGINDLRQLAIATDLMRERILLQHLANGVCIEDPATTFIDHGVEIGRDTRILPCTVIRSGVVIGENCEIGPFSHLRVGTVLEERAEIGNFVETKKTRIGVGTKAKHLTYLGDAEIGAGANIGCGTITANYDGKNKFRTVIGDGAFVGSGTVLVAPSTMGARSMTGAGAIVTRETKIEADEVWVGVPAKRLRERTSARDGGQS